MSRESISLARLADASRAPESVAVARLVSAPSLFVAGSLCAIANQSNALARARAYSSPLEPFVRLSGRLVCAAEQ